MPVLGLALSVCLLGLPVQGPVVAGFSPQGAYGGHWGADIAVAPGTPVRAAAAGVVTFAGSVAGRLSVTVHHGGSVRTSVSYLSSLAVGRGRRVGRNTVLGLSGTAHGTGSIHFSLRIGDRYLDPLVSCRALDPGPGVRLAGGAIGAFPYSVVRAPRHPRRDLRSSPHRSSGRW